MGPLSRITKPSPDPAVERESRDGIRRSPRCERGLRLALIVSPLGSLRSVHLSTRNPEQAEKEHPISKNLKNRNHKRFQYQGKGRIALNGEVRKSRTILEPEPTEVERLIFGRDFFLALNLLLYNLSRIRLGLKGYCSCVWFASCSSSRQALVPSWYFGSSSCSRE